MKLNLTQPAGPSLYSSVRAGLIANGTNINEWCQDNGMRLPNVKAILMGVNNGKRSTEVRKKVIADIQALAKGA